MTEYSFTSEHEFLGSSDRGRHGVWARDPYEDDTEAFDDEEVEEEEEEDDDELDDDDEDEEDEEEEVEDYDEDEVEN